MREYDDDNIRLYTPVLQRVIILLAVIIAVPVVMWTITTMVRTYVAPPKAPTFQRMTETQPADTASIAAPTVAAPAAVAEQAQTAAPPARLADAGASEARALLLDIKKPPVQPPSQNATTAQSPAAPITAVPAPPAKMAAAQPMPSRPRPDAGGTRPSRSDNGRRYRQAPRRSPPIAPTPPAAAPSNIVWPNPNANTPPAVGSTSGDAANNPAPSAPVIAAPQPPASSDTASDDLPPGEPISGRSTAAAAPAGAVRHGADGNPVAAPAPGRRSRHDAGCAGRGAGPELRPGSGAGTLLNAQAAARGCPSTRSISAFPSRHRSASQRRIRRRISRSPSSWR